MQITVNGKPAESGEKVTILQMLKEQKVEAPEYVSVELNGAILDRGDFNTTTLSEGDAIEFLYFMGGGAL
jgi:sulfur carrier protein